MSPSVLDPAPHDEYRVKVQFRERVLGGMPKNPEIVAAWLAAMEANPKLKSDLASQYGAPATPEGYAKEVKLATYEGDEPTQEEERVWCGFRENEVGLYLAPHQVVAALMDSASSSRLTTSRVGSKNIIARNLWVRDAGAPSNPLTSPLYFRPMKRTADGRDEFGSRVNTPKGPRSTLHRYDYIEGAEMEWIISVLPVGGKDGSFIREQELRGLLAIAQEHGLGAARPRGYGRFDVTAFEKIQSA